MQDQEPGRPGADDARLPEAQRGPLGRGEVPAEASREAGKEEARPLLKWRSRRRSDSSSSWPGTSTCGTPASSSRSPEGSSRTGDLTSARAAAALRGDVARQVLAPKPRSLGKSAAEGPNDRLQADLAEIIPDLVQEEGNYVVTTDMGNEFRGLEAALPGGAVHRQKDPSDRNATAVVDRAIQTLKKDLAGMVARRGGGWGEHVDEAAEAYNARPHQAVTVAPEDVETMPTATFRVYQDNATKFQHNKKLTEGRKRRLEEAGAFRAPTNARRSFEPQYGPAREIARIDSMVVRATDGTETLLKHALPVPRGSAEPKAKLTRPPVPLAIRQLQDFNPGPVAPP